MTDRGAVAASAQSRSWYGALPPAGKRTSFPTRIRAAGQGFTYNFGRGVAAFNPTLVGIATATVPLGKAIAIFAVVAYALVIVAAFLLAETGGKELAAD